MTVENCQPKTAENFENCQAKMTLDEVIAQYEYCLTLGFTACGDCKYRDTDGVCKMREKALLFLKEYREKKQEIFDISADYVALKQYWAEQQENSPLTWEQLQSMEGKPVWVGSKRFGNHWYLNRGIKDESCMYFVGHYGENVLLYHDDLGKIWQAYRKGIG